MIGRDRKATFAYIKDRVWQKINFWSGKCLSKAGREVMIKICFAVYSYLCDEHFSATHYFDWLHWKDDEFFLVGTWQDDAPKDTLDELGEAVGTKSSWRYGF